MTLDMAERKSSFAAVTDHTTIRGIIHTTFPGITTITTTIAPDTSTPAAIRDIARITPRPSAAITANRGSVFSFGSS